jgi:hypothetical protein
MGRDYPVFVVSLRTLKKLGYGKALGVADFGKRQIYLVPHVDIKQTLLHEILEVLNYELELSLPHPKIKSLENALFQIISDNKLTFHA